MNDINMDDFELGNKVIGYTLQAFGACLATAAAWSCSSVVMGIVVLIAMNIAMSLLMALLHFVLIYKLPAPTVAKLGHAVGGFSVRITNLFSRKAA